MIVNCLCRCDAQTSEFQMTGSSLNNMARMRGLIGHFTYHFAVEQYKHLEQRQD